MSATNNSDGLMHRLPNRDQIEAFDANDQVNSDVTILADCTFYTELWNGGVSIYHSGGSDLIHLLR